MASEGFDASGAGASLGAPILKGRCETFHTVISAAIVFFPPAALHLTGQVVGLRELERGGVELSGLRRSLHQRGEG